MCGIAGILSRKLEAGSVAAGLRDRMRHRGPDDAGLFVCAEQNIALAHQRLSIIDLSSEAHQPMSTADGRWTIVFNGEIYNYVELKRELADDVQFRTESDTEVLLEAYRRWGHDVLQKLRGPFAFAIWDKVERSLFIARDRVGKRPLYYSWDETDFAFASELKALRALPGFDPQIDPAAADCYFALGYVPAPHTIFRGVRKLAAGHSLTLRDGSLSLQRYWRPEDVSTMPAEDREVRLSECRALVADAVKVRLRADVPVGVFLSGGVDSSIVAYEAVAQGGRPEAVSVSFEGDQTDLPYATLMAERLGLRHHTVEVAGPGTDDIVAIVNHYDEPFADSSNVPSYLMARASRGLFKVALNGDGGDEAFAGYRHYEHIAIKQLTKSIASALTLCDGQFRNPWSVYLQSKAHFNRRHRKALLGQLSGTSPDAFGEWIEREPFLRAFPGGDALKRALWADRHVNLANGLMYKMDMALGAFGMEGRSPLLDAPLLDWAQGLGASDLVVGRVRKVVLGAAYAGKIPREILRRGKKGFGAPIDFWLRGPIRDLAKSMLPCPSLVRSAQSDLLAAYYDRSDARVANKIWTLLVFAIWSDKVKAHW
jgi:asparagine synthase (glutamine-hydrolysing)